MSRPHAETVRETVWTAAVAALGLVLFLATFSPNVALGDAPESVSGIRSLGVLHTPGYAAYVLLGQRVGDARAVGQLGLSANLFSVVCSVVALAAVFALGRLFGEAASRPHSGR